MAGTAPRHAGMWSIARTVIGLAVAVAAVWSAIAARAEHAIEAMLVGGIVLSLPAAGVHTSAMLRWPHAAWVVMTFALAPAVLIWHEVHGMAPAIAAIFFITAACAHAAGWTYRHRSEAAAGSGIPVPLAAGIILMPMLLGVYAGASPGAAPWLGAGVFVAMAVGLVAPGHLPRATWRFVRWQPNLIILIIAAGFVSYLGRNVWVGAAWMPVIYLAMCVACVIAAAWSRRFERRRRTSIRPLALGCVLAGVAPTLVMHTWPADAELAGHTPPRGDIDARTAAPNVDAPAGIFIGFAGPLNNEGLPPPWRLFRNPLVLGGRTIATAVPDAGETWAMRLATSRGSFALDMNCNPDPEVDWDLAWEWRVEHLPEKGDIRIADRADAAVQVGVYFDTRPWDASKPDLTPDGYSFLYTWDTTAPVDTIATRSFTLGTFYYEYKVFVLRTGEPDSDAWVRERRNLHDDFVRAYGFEPPPIRGVRVQSTSTNTKSSSAGLVRNIWLQPADDNN